MVIIGGNKNVRYDKSNKYITFCGNVYFWFYLCITFMCICNKTFLKGDKNMALKIGEMYFQEELLS